MPLYWPEKSLSFAVETTYGVDGNPLAADGLVAKEVSLSPMEGTDIDRDLDQPFFGSSGTIPAELHSKLSFKVEMAPSGSPGVPPEWGPLLRCCGCAETTVANTSVTYNPITRDPEAGTFYFVIGNTRHVIVGARGTVSFEMSVNNIPYMSFEFWGLFRLPSVAVRPAPDLTNWATPQAVSTAFSQMTIDGRSDLATRKFMLNLRSQVEPRFLINLEEILISDRQEAVELTIEAVDVDIYDPYAAAFNATEVPLVFRHGVGAGRVATFNLPKCQMQRPQGFETPQNITEWPLRLIPKFTAGNDQWTLELT